MAMTLIQRTNVTTNANLAYTFSSIPQTYVDLLLVATAQVDYATADGMFIRLNGDTGSSYSGQIFRYTQTVGTNGSYVPTNSYITESILQMGQQTTYQYYAGGSMVYFPNYVSTSTAKASNTKVGSSPNLTNNQAAIGINAFQWTGTAAISSITISGYGAYPTSFSTYSLYGIS
jgi:hypothetical protein